MILSPILSKTCMLKHPLDPLSADEIRRTATIVRQARVEATTHYIFISITLKEPSKESVMAYFSYDANLPKPVANLEREALVVLVDKPSGCVHDITVSLTKGLIMDWKKLQEGQQPNISYYETMEAERVMRKDKLLIEECRRLGITEMNDVYIEPWCIGYSNIKGKRLLQANMYMRTSSTDNQYAHPLDIYAIYDVNKGQVISVHTSKRRNSKFERSSIPLVNHQYLPEHLGQDSLRKDIKPINILQPEGVSFSVNGNELYWQKWNMHIGFNHREGLVINNITYKEHSNATPRPLFYRISLAEMVVPYANPYEPYNHKMVFDAGEYGLGGLTNSLDLGCDCVGSIQYLDAVLTSERGEPMVIPNAICIHEEDAGLLFKHTDYRTNRAHSARSRRLVISHIVTAGNYDYGIYYYFYQDGTIQFEAKATGQLNTHALAEDEDPAPYGTIVAPRIDAQHHQHMFNLRVDPMLDGVNNSVAETDIVASELPVGHIDNPVGNAFMPVTKIFNDTHEAQSIASLDRHRSWRIINENVKHPYTKQPVGFKVINMSPTTLLCKPGSVVHNRARFATKNIWVTPYDHEQKYPAGYHMYQSEPGMGLSEWTKEPVSVRNKSIVLWVTFGLDHIPRVEDYPIMPVEACGIQLRPSNFFLCNPAIDVPPSSKQSTKSTYANVNGVCCGKSSL